MSELTSLRLVGAAQGFNWLPVFLAQEQGFFADQGVQIEYRKLGSVDKATKAVHDGAAELAITPPEGAIADYLSGGSLRIIGANSQRLPMSMVARAGITDLARLKGARIGTSSLSEGTAIYTRKLLEKVGLYYPKDYEFVLAGVHTARWEALQQGEIDAAPQPAPWSLLAHRDGYRLLGDISEAIPQIIFAAVVADATWIEKNPDTAQRVISAMAAGHALVNEPAHDQLSGEIYQRITTPAEPELAARGFAETRDLGMWPQGLHISPEAFDTTVQLMTETGLLRTEQSGADSGSAEQSLRPEGVLEKRFLSSG